MQLDLGPTPFGAPSLSIERLERDRFDLARDLNEGVFGERRLIFRLDRQDLVVLLARLDGVAAGYKVGYRESRSVFYSAKGGVLSEFRRRGIARALMEQMEAQARAMGYARLAFDTFPNQHPGMTVMALAEGYEVTAAGFNAAYRDYRLRFERALWPAESPAPASPQPRRARR